jgi:uridine monophosphate synthetase
MLPAEQLESLAITLHDIGAVRFGEFALHSGKNSPIYIDLRLLPSYPAALRQAAIAYRHIMEPMDFDLIAATPLTGLPIGTAICLEMDKPLIYRRKKAKKYGTGKLIEGKWTVGQNVVLIDDLITSGDSLLKGLVLLKATGLRVLEAVVLIDRQQGGREALEEQGYRLHSAMTIRQLLAILERNERISSHQRAQVLRALS